MPRCSARWLPGTFVAMLLVPFVATESQTVSDSAGVQVVTNSHATLPPARAWRIDPNPTVVIGGQPADSDTINELQLVMGVTRLSDGRWAVGVQASHAVRFYDARGKYMGFAGRKGQGPGEFEQVMGVRTIRGDTLFVTDLGAVELFAANGKFAGQGASRSRGDRFVYPADVLQDGSYLGVLYDDGRGAPPAAGRIRRSQPVVHVSRDGTVIDTIGSLWNREEVFDGRTRWGYAVGYSTASLLAGHHSSFYLASPTNPEITQFTLAGKPSRLIRLPYGREKTSDAAIRDYREWYLAMPGEDGRPLQGAMKERRERQLEQIVFAEWLPPFGQLIVDRPGNLWVQRYEYRSAFFTVGPARTQTIHVATRWDVLDAAGRWLCTVDLPARFTPVEIGSDYIAGLARDEDEVEQVRVYRLLKP